MINLISENFSEFFLDVSRIIESEVYISDEYKYVKNKGSFWSTGIFDIRIKDPTDNKMIKKAGITTYNNDKWEEIMGNFISKICSHVYVEGALEAVKLYKEAFGLEDRGTPWLDDEGVLVYQELGRSGELFMSVSENKHLFAEFKKDYPDGVRPMMLFIVYFENEDDLRRAFELLYKEGNSSTGVKSEGDIICAFIDKFGVYWHFQVPKDWNASYVPK